MNELSTAVPSGYRYLESKAMPGKGDNQVEAPEGLARKILVADDHPLYREAVGRVIASDFEYSEVIEASDLDSVLKIARKNEDLALILLDLDVPGMHRLDGLAMLRNESPTIPVLIVSAKENKIAALQAISYGAVGFITKSSPRSEITAAIQQILLGNVYLHYDLIRSDRNGSNRQGCSDEASISLELLNSLTQRQFLVLERMAKGESNKQIAYNLHIAETTVKAHVSAILRKLRVHNRVQAILAASDVDLSQYMKR